MRNVDMRITPLPCGRLGVVIDREGFATIMAAAVMSGVVTLGPIILEE